MKYAVLIGALLVFAILFNQIVMGLYTLSFDAIKGDLISYLLLIAIWFGILLVARVFLNKKMHPKSSLFVFFGGTLHIGSCLAIYFYKVSPLLLILFPIAIGVAYWTRQRRPTGHPLQGKLDSIHPAFIDERGGLCVLRNGALGFTALKFFTLDPPLPGREFLLYLYHEQIECTFEIHRDSRGLAYTLVLITRGRDYESVQQQSVEQASHFRQFLRQLGIAHLEISDTLNILHAFYTPYFLYTPSQLDSKGIPVQFPHVSISGNEITVEQDLREQYFTVHALDPQFRPNQLHPFLTTDTTPFHLQVHLRPLSSTDIAARDNRFNQEYRQSLKRLTGTLEQDSEFQAASYLFNKVGEVAKEDLEPLLDQQELEHFRSIKRELHSLKDGLKVGLWEVACCCLSDVVLAQTLALHVHGKADPLPPQAFTSLVVRQPIGPAPVIASKNLVHLLPSIKEAPVTAVQSTT
jgi:hypothetical protein